MLAASPLDAIGNTPLILLDDVRPEGGARVVAKWEGANPTGSMKDRMALAMVRQAREEGLLEEGQPIVEFTGGSTGSSLAFVGSVLGHPVHIVTADCFAEEKTRTHAALGATVEVLETPEGKVHPGLIDRMQERVEEIRDETGAYWTHQISNPHQLFGYDALAEELLADAPGLTHFVMAVGTAGCAMGTAKGLRRRSCDAEVVLVEPAESPWLTKGEGGSHRVEGIAVTGSPPLLDAMLYERVLAVPEADGRAMCRRLARAGVFTGTSSGLNVEAAVQVAAELDPSAIVATVAVDSGLKYLGGGLFG